MHRIALLLAAGVSALTLASAAQAADLIISEPAAAGIVNVSGNWDGAFIGVFAGGGWGDVFVDGNDVSDVSGWLVGLDAGVNVTLAEGIVAGIVADIAWANIEDDDFWIDWTASLRGRLGFDAGAFLPYLTAGVAAAHAGISTSDDAVHFGWTVGAGVEFAVTQDVSIDLLYRFTDYGDEIYDPGPTDPVGYTTHTVTAGLRWRF